MPSIPSNTFNAGPSPSPSADDLQTRLNQSKVPTHEIKAPVDETTSPATLPGAASRDHYDAKFEQKLNARFKKLAGRPGGWMPASSTSNDISELQVRLDKLKATPYAIGSPTPPTNPAGTAALQRRYTQLGGDSINLQLQHLNNNDKAAVLFALTTIKKSKKYNSLDPINKQNSIKKALELLQDSAFIAKSPTSKKAALYEAFNSYCTPQNSTARFAKTSKL